MSRWTGRAPSRTRPRWTLSRSLVRGPAAGWRPPPDGPEWWWGYLWMRIAFEGRWPCGRFAPLGLIAWWNQCGRSWSWHCLWWQLRCTLLPDFFTPLVSVTYRLSLFLSPSPHLGLVNHFSLFFLSSMLIFFSAMHSLSLSVISHSRTLLYTLPRVSRVLSASARSRIIVWYKKEYPKSWFCEQW